MNDEKNKLDAFERRMKDTLDQFEVPYNSADWTEMESALSGGTKGWWLGGAGLITMVLAGALAIGGTTWYLLNNNSVAKGSNMGPTTGTTRIPAVGNNDGNANNNLIASETDAALATSTPGSSVQAVTKPESGDVVDNHSVGTKNVSPGGTAFVVSEKGSANKGNNAHVSVVEKAAAYPADHSLKTGTAASPKDVSDPADLKRSVATSSSEMTFRASVSAGCPGTSVDFKVENMPSNGIYLWNFGDGSFSNKPNPEHTFTKPGQYQVMLSMSAAGVGTIHNKPSSDKIVIHEAPKASFNVLKQEYDGHLPSVHFENRSMAGKSYQWSFGDGQTSGIAHPDHIYKKKGIYNVELTVTNDIGCVDQTMKEVRVEKDYNLDAPASFSPNGDGQAEAFIPDALRTLGVKFHLAIYDTNGGLMYETNDATMPWSGRVNNSGAACPTGEYVWVVDVRESLHLAETYTGKVKLMR